MWGGVLDGYHRQGDWSDITKSDKSNKTKFKQEPAEETWTEIGSLGLAIIGFFW